MQMEPQLQLQFQLQLQLQLQHELSTNWQALFSIARKSHCAANGRNLRPAEFSMGPTN